MSAAEVGVAYVRLLPSMDGFAGEVKRELGSSLTAAARTAADDAGKVITREISQAVEAGAGDVDLKGATSKIGDGFKVALAGTGLAGGALLAKGLSDAFEVDGIEKKLTAQLGGGEWATDAGKAAGDLYSQNFGDSVEQTADAIRRVVQNGLVDKNATQADIEAVTGQFLTFTDVLEQDMDRSTQAVKSMITSGLAGSTSEALDAMTKGIQLGGDKAGDFADTFQEYSTKFRDLGLSASDAAGLIAQGLNAGARDADTVADALKEVAIRAIDGSKASQNAFHDLGMNGDKMAEAFAEGGDKARTALQQVLTTLKGVEDPLNRDAIATGLFGTKAEDLGDALYSLDLDQVASMMDGSAGATDALGSAYNTAGAKVEGFKRQAMGSLINFLGNTAVPAITGLIDLVGPGLSKGLAAGGKMLSELGGGLQAFVAAFRSNDGDVTSAGFAGSMERLAFTMRDLLDKAQPVFDALKSGWETLSGFLEGHGEIMVGIVTALGIAIGAGLAVAIGSLVASAVAAAAPFIAVGAAIAAVGGGLVWLYNNVSGFKAFVDAVLPKLAEVFRAAFELVKTVVTDAVAIGTTLWSMFGDTILSITGTVFGTLGAVIQAWLDIIIGVFHLFNAVLHGDWSAAWDAVKEIATGWLSGVTAIFKGIFKVWWDLFGGAIEAIAGFFADLPGKMVSVLSGLADILTKPFRDAFNGIKSLWNNTVGGFSFKVPDFIPVIGGKGFSIPKMHTGGIVPGSGDVPILAKGGEGVFTPEQMAVLGRATTSSRGAATIVTLHADGVDQALLEWLRRSIRVRGGGNVQMALGS